MVPVALPTRPPTSTVSPIAPPTKAPASPVSLPTLAPHSPLLPVGPYNPYEATQTYYVNPSYRSDLSSSIATASGAVQSTLRAMMDVSSAYWIDVRAKITGNGTDSMQGILRDAVSQGTRQLVTFIVYDLPNRDCHAKASNGELCCSYNPDGTCNYLAGGDCSQGLAQYTSQYIDPMAAVLAQYQQQVEIVLIIEPDSLPNLATNAGDAKCGNTATSAAYLKGVAYAINKFKSLQLTMYLDAAHGGWLGWEDNMKKFSAILLSMPFPLSALRGFATNVANYQPIGQLCPFQSSNGLRNDYCLNGAHASDPCCADPCTLTTQWNPANNELNYAQLLRTAFLQATGNAFSPHMLIDTGRNGVGNMRQQCANWCNARGAGIGLLPTFSTAVPDLVDAYHWLKTPGESDGCTQSLPDGSACPRFDSFCASVDSIGSRMGEPRAPQAGKWFDYQIKMLASNAVFASSPLPVPTRPPPPIASPIVAKSPSLAPVMATPTRSPTAISPLAPSAPLSTSFFSTAGNQIVDSSGESVRITGVNWFGFETSSFLVHGLWTRSYKSMLDQVKSIGFNTLRIPFSNQMLLSSSTINGLNTNGAAADNAALLGLSPLQALDEIIRYSGSIGLRVFLDRHSAKADGFTSEDVWYIPGDPLYTEQKWVDDWVVLAARYRGNPTVIGADLFNEPKNTAQWVAWSQAASRCGDAIHAVNPDWLIIVEGTQHWTDGSTNWWGGNLRGVASSPVVLARPNKLVYSAHEYPASVWPQTWFADSSFPRNMPAIWGANWGYIYSSNLAPILIGEFGSKLATSLDKTWMTSFVAFMNGDFLLDGGSGLALNSKGLSFTYWCLNPNSGDTGGILNEDWTTVDPVKLSYIQASLTPFASSSTASNPLPSSSSSSSSSLTTTILCVIGAALLLLVGGGIALFVMQTSHIKVSPFAATGCEQDELDNQIGEKEEKVLRVDEVYAIGEEYFTSDKVSSQGKSSGSQRVTVWDQGVHHRGSPEDV